MMRSRIAPANHFITIQNAECRIKNGRPSWPWLTFLCCRAFFERGDGDFGDDLLNQISGGDFAEAAFGAEDDAVRENGRGNFLDVVGQDVIAAAEGGHRLGGAKESDGG